MKQKIVDNPVFSFYLPSDVGVEGEFRVGTIDSSKFDGNLTWIPIIKREGTSYWKISVQNMQLGNDSVSSVKEAIVDSGTSLIVGPSDEVDKILQILKAENVGGIHIVDCDSVNRLPLLTLKIGDRAFELIPEDYIMRQLGLCFVGINGMDFRKSNGDPFWILGSVFLRRYFTVFDIGREHIGLALLK